VSQKTFAAPFRNEEMKTRLIAGNPQIGQSAAKLDTKKYLEGSETILYGVARKIRSKRLAPKVRSLPRELEIW